MTQRLPSSLLLGCVALLLLASAAEAQVVRPYKTPYIEARVGLSVYGGDADDNPDDEFSEYVDDLGWVAGGEIGYQFTSSLGFGISVHYGDYPELESYNTARGDLQIADDTGRLQIWGTFRYFVFPSSRITPYVRLGLGYTPEAPDDDVRDVNGNLVDLPAEPGWGPVVGLGTDLLLGRKFSLYIEANAAYYFPDNAVDRLNPEEDRFLLNPSLNPSDPNLPSSNDDADFDWLGSVSAGARYWFRAPITEVEATIDCTTSLEVGQAGTFTAFVNEDATGPLTYMWEFGDGSSADGLVATHAYDAPGTYTVTFTATGPANADVETCLVTVAEPPAEAPVLTACQASPSLAGAGERVQFSASVTGSRPIDFRWTFGDGGSSDQLNASHVYNEPGTYVATLTATNEAGTATCDVEVTVIDRFCDEVTELNTVYFDRSMSTLDEMAMERLDENIAVLERCPEICVVINAYTDSRERDPLRLSERRAAAVEAYYVQNGIGEERSVARGLGVAPDCDYKEDQGASCRRAESIPTACMDLDQYED